MNKTMPLIVAIGNPLMGDDGVGIYILDRLREKHPHWNFLELNTPGYSILSYIQDTKSLILVDAADFGGKPGEIKKVRQQEIQSIKKTSSLDLHGTDILAVIEKASSWGIFLEEFLLYCIQIESISPLSGLTPFVRDAAFKVIEDIEILIKNNSLCQGVLSSQIFLPQRHRERQERREKK